MSESDRRGLINDPKQPKLPPFLKETNWINFQDTEFNPMNQLIWRITGIKPINLKHAQYLTAKPPEKKFKLNEKSDGSFTQNLGNNMYLEMIQIPGDTFMMGSPKGKGEDNEKPQHKVTIQPFFISKYPVTQVQWKVIASLPKVEHDLNPNPAYFKDREDSDHRPVENVSWEDAVEFCKRLSKQTEKEYRLPTEAEWEYTCRAGTTTLYHFGENITDKLANYDNNIDETTSVGKYPPNAFGLYDMHGNVWEWCQDNWHDNYKNAPTDGSTWLSRENNFLRVLRGGSWNNNSDECRSEYREFATFDECQDSIGFRVTCINLKST